MERKIRGQRLEVEEIETLLLKYPGIREAVITADNDSMVNELIAFIVPENANIEDDRIEEYLSQRLPAFMVPSRFISIDKIPLTVTGKIDYKTLNTFVVEKQTDNISFRYKTSEILKEK